MEPGVGHIVLSTENSLAVGGHFFNSANFLGTLKTVGIEHFIGRSVTNNDHSHSPLMLFKIAQYYLQVLQSGDLELARKYFYY